MLVIPAIDIRGGNCVRLTRGKLDDETIYSKDPVFIAKLWQAKGAKRIHVVDLDGAFNGIPKNWDIIKNIRAAIDIQIEYGGGVRSMKTIDSLFEIGIDFVIVGTLAIYNPEILRMAIGKYGEKIIVGVDVHGSKVAIGGWKETTSVESTDLVVKLKDMGVKEIIFTDIQKDGTLEGPNIDALREISRKSGLSVIASGGVSNIEDIKKLMELESEGVSGIIVGRALYTEDLKLEEALKFTEIKI